MVPNGFYIVHRFDLPVSHVADLGHNPRSTLVHYPPFLRYRVFRSKNDYFVINGRGSVVVLQDIGAMDEATARARFDDVGWFGAAYNSMLARTKEFLGVSLTDFDDSSFLWIGAPTTQITWKEIILSAPTAGGERWAVNILLEALLVYALCKASEKCLSRLLETGDQAALRSLQEFARDMLLVEQPHHFLVNSNEIDLMKKFYEPWQISEYVVSLQSRFSQAIDTFNLHFNQLQAQRALTLNRIVGGATVLALLSVASDLAAIVPILGADRLKLAIALVAIGLIVLGLVGNRARKLFDAIRSRLRSRSVNLRIRELVKHAPR